MTIIDWLFLLLSKTPFYVWLILGYLIFIGIIALKTRKTPLYNLGIMPIILFATKYKYLANMHFVGSLILGIIGGVTINYHTPITVLKKEKALIVPGSYFTLVFLLIIFAIRYFFGFLDSTAPEIATQYFYLNMILNGAILGYCLGRIGTYFYKYINHK